MLDYISPENKNPGGQNFTSGCRIADEAQKELVDELYRRIEAVNELLKEAHDRGDCVDAAGCNYSAEGPRVTFEITKVTNGFWKEGQ